MRRSEHSGEPDITSTRNERVVAAAKLHQRKTRAERGLTLIEGPHLLAMAVEAGMSLREVFGLVGDVHLDGVPAGIEVVTVTPEVLRRLAATEHPRGPVAVLDIPQVQRLETCNTVVMVKVADPGNAGTIVRSAAAFGFQVAVADDSVDIWAPKVLRAAAGAHFLTRIGGVDDDPLGALNAAGVFSAALVVAGGKSPGEVTVRPIGILVGSEAHGLDAALTGAADDRITLPMPGGTESLNAAIAASIAMYDLAAPT